MPATVWLLTLIQALAMSAGAMMVMVGGVLGSELASDPALATLPLAMMIVGTACGVVPVTRLMQRYGRKRVFIGVSLLAMCASLFAARNVIDQHFIGFASSAFMLGLALAGFQQIRFAAMELVVPEDMPKAASTVLLGGLVAAIVGPELATLGNILVSQTFVGAFYLMAALSFCCAMLFTQIPATPVDTMSSAEQANNGARPLSAIIVQPVFILAVSSSVVGYALMSFIMTATPVHMHVVELHSLEHTKWVIQSHIFAMFFPSIFSGWLIASLGVKKIIYAGLGAYTITIVIALSGVELFNYWVALILLGIGWNFLFVGGTCLLAQSYQPSEKFKVQGLNEFLVFGCQATAALSAGMMLNLVGWQGLLLSSFAVVIVQLMILNWQRTKLKVHPGY
ncbi:MAG: MFS family permease [Paraglaciecola sp.]|jgi:MFS family permease